MRNLFIATSLLALAACSPAHEAADQSALTGHDGMEHGAAVPADEGPLPDNGVVPVVDVSAPWIRPHPQGRDVTAAYFIAELSAGAADRLLEARIDGAERVELHTHTMNAEGMMQMRQTGAQRINAGEALRFVPAGLHLMVFGLEPVLEGDRVEGVLVFERAGEVAVTFEARSTAP